MYLSCLGCDWSCTLSKCMNRIDSERHKLKLSIGDPDGTPWILPTPRTVTSVNSRTCNISFAAGNVPLCALSLCECANTPMAEQSCAPPQEPPVGIFAVALRIPPFWPTDPAVLFAQIEAVLFAQIETQFMCHGINKQRTRYEHVITALALEVATEVCDHSLRPRGPSIWSAEAGLDEADQGFGIAMATASSHWGAGGSHTLPTAPPNAPASGRLWACTW